MAIKVNGTTVIDNSRNFTNIAGGFKTVNGTSVVGSGNISAGASTTQGEVGTYAFLSCNTRTNFGTTRSGSSLYRCAMTVFSTPSYNSDDSAMITVSSSTVSGTWRCMGGNTNTSGQYKALTATVWVRIS
jgi:hypothetical protein